MFLAQMALGDPVCSNNSTPNIGNMADEFQRIARLGFNPMR